MDNPTPNRTSQKSFWKTKVGLIVREMSMIFGTVLLLQVGLVQAYHVPTGSMEQTIMTGDFLIADKVTLGPRTLQWVGVPYTQLGTHVPALKLPGFRDPVPGDIVVVEVPIEPRTPYVKRVVAVGGQTVEVRNKQLYVDGHPADVPEYLMHGDKRVLPKGLRQQGIPAALGNRDNFGPYTVPDEMVFLMGDNRDFSLDSRYFGPVPESNIIGRARIVHFSYDEESEGIPFWKRLRFDRVGTILN
ncbi:signal peptidase I [bacterium]|nr:signal peptidase I [bacterium]